MPAAASRARDGPAVPAFCTWISAAGVGRRGPSPKPATPNRLAQRRSLPLATLDRGIASGSASVNIDLLGA